MFHEFVSSSYYPLEWSQISLIKAALMRHDYRDSGSGKWNQPNGIGVHIIIEITVMSSDLTVNPTTASKRKVDDSFDIEDMVFPLLKPIVTGRPDPRTKMSCSHEQQKNDSLQDMVEVTVENELLAMEDQDGCKTPNSKENKIPIVVNCPLAPRKPRVKPRRSTSSLPQGFFFFPPDLDSAFIVCRVSPPREKLHWPKRISGLKFEQNGGHHI